MSRMWIQIGAAFLALAALLLFASLASANGPGYTLGWWTVDGGGSGTTGGTYTLRGAVGQPDAAVWSGAGYTLAGGFWNGVTAGHRVYLPLAIRNG